MYEHTKTLKTIRREGRPPRTQRVWCKQPLPKKIKFSNRKIKNFDFKKEKRKFKFSKIKKSGFLSYTCVRVRVKDEKSHISPDADAVICRRMSNLTLFVASEHILYVRWTIYPLCLRKRLRTL